MDIGFEFQTNEHSLVLFREEDRRLYHPDSIERKWFTGKQVMIASYAYADKTTDLVGETRFRRFLSRWRQVEDEQQPPCLLRLSTGDHPKGYTIDMKDPNCNEMFNDAEFVVTCRSRVGFGDTTEDLLRVCVSRLEEASRHLDQKLRGLVTRPIHRMSVETEDKPRGVPVISHRDEFPFHSISVLSGKGLALLSRETAPEWRDTSFYLQCTLGLSLRDVVRVLLDLEQECGRRGKEMIRFRDSYECLRERTEDPLFLAVGSLFLYAYRTHNIRKENRFILRHMFVDLLPVVFPDKELFQEWEALLPDETTPERWSVREFARVLYDGIPMNDLIHDEKMPPEIEKQYLENKKRESMLDITAFAVRHGEDRQDVLDLRLLIEFREVHPMLVRRLSTKAPSLEQPFTLRQLRQLSQKMVI